MEINIGTGDPNGDPVAAIPEGLPAATAEFIEKPKPELPTPEAILSRLDAIGNDLRALIVDAKKLATGKGFEPHEDPMRCIAIAQSELQTGFLWLKRSINRQKGF